MHLQPIYRYFVFFLFLMQIVYSCSEGNLRSNTADLVPDKPDFNYHVKPILSDKCFACHGPDEQKIEAGLQLHLREKATQELESTKTAIVPGKPNKSELYQRIMAHDPELLMPPPESNLALTEVEKTILTRWIEQGAEYKPHWSFITPETPELPEVDQTNWVNNPIDHFVLDRLEKEGLTPSPEADKLTLIRRVSFDLTGLPPSLEEVDNFLADESDNAYEKLVDRLLASPRYGERMAMDWLDVARYADSHGFHADGYRMMWPWRDWVIRAFNENLPVSDFITWQLAGDLLPNPTREQLLATGFNRNNPVNSESGIDPEEYRLEGVFDRANTTAKSLLGLTMECARCHDHKYDPIAQKEYFQFSAFFNNVDELGMMSVDGNAAPTMLLVSDEVAEIAEYIECEIGLAEGKLQQREEKVLENSALFTKPKIPTTYQQNGLVGHYPLDKFNQAETSNLVNTQQSARSSGEVEHVAGYSGSALRFDSEYEHLSLPGIGDFERTDRFSMGAWVYPENRSDYRVIMSNAGHKNEHWRGYEMYLDGSNRLAVRLTHRPPDNRVEVFSLDSIPMKSWSHVFFTYDGSSRADGVQLYINGKTVAKQTRYDRLEQSIQSIDAHLNHRPRPVRVGKSYRIALELGIFGGAIDEIRIYDRELTVPEVAGLVGNTFWLDTNDNWKPEEQAALADYYLHHQDTIYRNTLQQLGQWYQRKHQLLDTIPEVMVMREMDQARKTYILDRGVYDAPTEEVQAVTPDWLMAFPEELPQNRLGLARWLVHPEHPLTARVLVNRYWHLFFGRGIVASLEDFGNQGDLPTHPELLDWLARELIRSGWDLKAFLKTIVTSATYRQSSEADAALLERDPQNELLARGPRYRLPAEMIRDNALVAAGLLVEKIGGPSVKTYQPEGIWDNTHFSKLLTRYAPDEGENLYRRSLYTFIRRTAPPPTMTVFDAPDRSMCVVRRQSTNTPLQALLLMNEPQLLEAGRLIAERAIQEAGPQTVDQISYAFRLLSGRSPMVDEQQLLQDLYREEYEKYDADETAASALLSVGDFPSNEDLPAASVAALAATTNVVMNFYDTYTKK